MSDENNIDREVTEALDERLTWINTVTDLVAADNWQSVTKAIDELDDEHLRSMIYVLILARGNDLNKMRDLASKADAAPMN